METVTSTDTSITSSEKAPYMPPKFNVGALSKYIRECEENSGVWYASTLRSLYPYKYNETNFMTCLYITRAWHRGKLHRTNPPQSIRDRNRSLGLPDDHGWDAWKHATAIAEKIMQSFPLTERE